MDENRIHELNEICRSMRRDILKMSNSAGSSGVHFGGSLSMVEIAAALYCEVMHISEELLENDTRDRFILSKGHGVPAVYAALHQLGIVTDEMIETFKADESALSGHPCMNSQIGVEFSTGSLGQGLSQGAGSALALRKRGNITSRVFVVLGDGECDEGSVWEAAMFAAQFKLKNLIAIVDRNHLQYDGDTEEIIGLESLEQKWKSFGWDCEVIDGHNIEECCEAFQKKTDKPAVVIADTVKGKGISFMENDPSWHHKVLTKDQKKIAMEELGIC